MSSKCLVIFMSSAWGLTTLVLGLMHWGQIHYHHTLIVGPATLPVDVVRNRNFLENVVQTNNYNDIGLFLYDIFTLSMNAFVKNLQMIYKVVVVKCNPRLVCKTTLFGRTVLRFLQFGTHRLVKKFSTKHFRC